MFPLDTTDLPSAPGPQTLVHSGPPKELWSRVFVPLSQLRGVTEKTFEMNHPREMISVLATETKKARDADPAA